MRALISGGTGFVAAHLSQRLLADGIEVFLFGRGDPPAWQDEARVRLFNGDIRDAETVLRIVSDVRPDEIYHLAAISSVPASTQNPWLTFEVNVGGTLNLLEATMKVAPKARLLNVSSGQVYGPASESPAAWSESSSIWPSSPYATSKAMCELLCRQYVAVRQAHVVTARSFNHIGPGQSTDFVIASFAHQFAMIEAELSPPVLHVGNLDVARDFTDVRDVVRAYPLLLKTGVAGAVYNVCSGRTRTLSDAITILQQLTAKKVEIRVEEARKRAVDVRGVPGDPSRIQSEIGWTATISFETSLRDILDDWRSRIRRTASVAQS